MNHIIKKQTLSISIPEGYDAWEMQDRFKEVFNGEILPRLEKVCDELGLDDKLSLKLDQLIIETGAITHQELTTLWVDEVEKAFRDELLNHAKERFNEKSFTGLIKSGESELNVLMYFLEKGVLPWWVSDEFKLSPEQLLSKALAEQPNELVSEILKVESKTTLVKRLCYQFEIKSIRQLLKQFKPAKTAPLLQQFKQLCRGFKALFPKLEASILATEIHITLDRHGTGADSKQLFELLFKYVIEESVATDKLLLDKLHKQLTSKQNENKEQQLLEYNEVLILALKTINRVLDSGKTTPQNGDKAPNTDSAQKSVSRKAADKISQPQTSSETKAPEASENTSGPDQSSKQSDQKPDSAQEKSSDKGPSTSTESDNKVEGALSAQDQRAWEHIERIKKLQLAKLGQDGETRERADHEKVDSENLQKSEQPSPSGLSEAQTHRHQRTESELSIKAQHESGVKKKARQQGANPQKPMLTEDQTSRRDKDITESESEKTNQSVQGSENKLSYTAEPDNESSYLSIEEENKSVNQSSNQPLSADHKQPGSHFTNSLVRRKPDKNSVEYWQEELELVNECYIQNAGLILLWPYLGHFFKDLGFVAEGAFKTKYDQMQAALVLQHLLSPEPELQEYKLPLNKLLSGLKISEPVGKSIELSAENLKRCDNLLQATIHNWSALKGTSPEGFQGSFLHRNGVLKRKDKNWLLQVEKMPFDMLMEQLPWPIGIVKLSWMNKPIYVEW